MRRLEFDGGDLGDRLLRVGHYEFLLPKDRRELGIMIASVVGAHFSRSLD